MSIIANLLNEMGVYSDFDRVWAKEVAEEVRKQFPGIRTSNASITGPSLNQYFLQFIQPGFQTLETYVRAGTAWEARAKGWEEYLKKYGHEPR
jgi:hypothetical protein